ncbi:MAG: zinc ribbon domain-containing protein, partial [Oscillospiraceae bacterium]|nr:zinc ribbon domain-containing protein [Oscillospiraceae bacterium]
MARFCRECGSELKPGISFCTECGAKVPEEIKPEAIQKPVPAPNPVPAPVPKTMQTPAPTPVAVPADDAPAKGSKYEPITTWGYVGILLLMCIPVIGLVFVIIWACGGCRKINKRNLSRAYLIFMAISLVISIMIGIIIGITAGVAAAATGSIFTDTPAITEPQSENENKGGLSAIFDALEGITGSETNPAMEDLNELEQILNGLEGITGEESGYGDLIDGAQKANEDAEAANNGWPKELRKYPGGAATEIASYRTEISGTTKEEMLGYIEQPKADGYVYTDFYDFGLTEDDM